MVLNNTVVLVLNNTVVLVLNHIGIVVRAGNRLGVQYRLSLAQNRLTNRLITG